MTVMPRGYPIAARQRPTYFQPSRRSTRPLPGTPTPANDNNPAANDNVPPDPERAHRRRQAQALAGYSRRGRVILGRVNPWIEVADFVLQNAYGVMLQMGEGQWTLPGWNLHHTCPVGLSAGPPSRYVPIPGALLNSCLINQAVPVSQTPSPTQTRVGYYSFTHNPGWGDRYATHSVWTRPAQTVVPDYGLGPQFVIPTLPTLVPVENPVAEPFLMPARRFMPAPRPMPYRLVPYRRFNPQASPVEQSHFGYRMQPHPSVGTGGATGRPLPSSPPALPKPPPKGGKDLKGLYNRAFGAVQVFLGPATEAKDIVESFYKALPRGQRRRWEWGFYRRHGRQPNAFERAWYLFQNAEDVEMSRALWNLIRMHFEDMLWAALSRGANRYSRRTGAIPGVQVGPAL